MLCICCFVKSERVCVITFQERERVRVKSHTSSLPSFFSFLPSFECA